MTSYCSQLAPIAMTVDTINIDEYTFAYRVVVKVSVPGS